MSRLIIFILISIVVFDSNVVFTQHFEAEQRMQSRVKLAYQHFKVQLTTELAQSNINVKKVNVFLRGFKLEKKLELWVKHKDSVHYELFREYDFCILSGTLGPKLKQGDLQVPEGYYQINRFNPWSAFHLSLGLNYPNKADKILNQNNRLGGDIFIHGDCVSIGCIPITNDGIEELYLLALMAKTSGQELIDVHLFPFRMDSINLSKLVDRCSNKKMKLFWTNLSEGYLYFEEHKMVPKIRVNQNGYYLIDLL